MRYRLFICALTLSIATCPTLSSSASEEWRSYVNVRYGFTICYPKNLLIAQGEAGNSDGQTFKAKDGSELRAFGSNNVFSHSLSREVETQARHFIGQTGKIIYRASKPEWEVVSGVDGRQMAFYSKTFERDDQFVTFQLSYPKSLNKRYKPIVEHLSRCFHLTDGHA